MREFNVELKQYYDGPVTPNQEETKKLILSNKGEFELVVGEPQLGDIILIRLLGIECHIAVYVPKGKLIHSVRTTGSCMEPTEKYKANIVGYFRLKGLASD